MVAPIDHATSLAGKLCRSRWPSIRTKALSRHTSPCRCVRAPCFAREVEDQRALVNSFASPRGGSLHQPLIRPVAAHDASMRTPSLSLDARAPNQLIDLACLHPSDEDLSLRAGFADQRRRRAAGAQSWPGSASHLRSILHGPAAVTGR